LHSIEFPYKKLIGGFSPIIPVTLHGPKGSSLFEAYVDSGAMMSLFDSVVADLLGISWRTGKKRPFIAGDGKVIHGFMIPLRIEIGDTSFVTSIAFSQELKIGFNLLGRSGVFSQFEEIVFQEKKRKLVFRV
jgi:hypothetical protein